jgi:hypothetical protein
MKYEFGQRPALIHADARAKASNSRGSMNNMLWPCFKAKYTSLNLPTYVGHADVTPWAAGVAPMPRISV